MVFETVFFLGLVDTVVPLVLLVLFIYFIYSLFLNLIFIINFKSC